MLNPVRPAVAQAGYNSRTARKWSSPNFSEWILFFCGCGFKVKAGGHRSICGGNVFHSEFMVPAIAGASVFLIGVGTLKREPLSRSASEWFVSLGMVFFAAPLAAFGAEHFVIPRIIAGIVPPWLPARLGIAYFVGAALIAASLSFIFRKRVRLVALLLAVMFLLFVCLIHVPGAATHWGNRDFRIDALRDSAFGVATFALFLHLGEDEAGSERRRSLLRMARVWIAVVVLAFAVLQLVHPECSPGVPSLRITPAWIPLPLVLGYGTGGMLLILGVAMLFERTARVGAVVTAMWMTALTVFLYLADACFFLPATQGLLGVNYVFDTLLFAGAMLLLARTLPLAPAMAVDQASGAPALVSRGGTPLPLG